MHSKMIAAVFLTLLYIVPQAFGAQFDGVGGTLSSTHYTETESDVTMTFTGDVLLDSDNAPTLFIDDGGGAGSSSGSIFGITNDQTKLTFTFTPAINITSLVAFTGDYSDEPEFVDFTFTDKTPGSTNPSVTKSIPQIDSAALGNDVVNLNWSSVSQFEVTFPNGPVYTIGFDNLVFTTAPSNNAPTAASFTASPIYQNTAYAFATSNFSYSDSDSDPLALVRVVTVPGVGTLWVDSDGSGTVNGAESAIVNGGTVSNVDLDAGRLKYLNTSGSSSSFTFKVNDGKTDSAATYTATLSVTALPTVSFTSASQTSPDETGTLTITAQLSASTAQNVTVPFTVNGSSTATGGGTDYSITASPLTIIAGSTTATITITIASDAIDEANETVIVDMGTPTNATQGGTTTHTATITDDDAAPTVTFTSASQSSAAETGTMTITAQLSGVSGKTVTVPFTVNGASTATGGGTDYSITASPATISAGSTSVDITITIANDAIDENDETVIIDMDAPTNATLGTTSSHTATITDDDTAPTVSFTSASQSSAGESGTMTITAQLSAVSGKTVTVPFSVNGSSTATGSGTDYSITASPLTISAGSTSADITITITNDSIDENDETVIVDMGNPTNATLGTTTSHTATITDDDAAPTVSFTSASQSSAGESGTMTITAQLSAVSGRTVSVPFTVNAASTATGGGTDYTITASPMTINTGSTIATFTITIASDDINEANETVIVDMGTPTNATQGGTTTHTATITDDDAAPTVTFTSASQSSAGESGTITITAQLSGVSGKTVTVPFTVNGASTATGGGTDYTITASPMTINAGSTTATITITIVSDDINEASETVIIDMGAPTNASVGAITTHTATIVNTAVNEAPVLSADIRTLTAIDEDNVTNTGTTVADVLASAGTASDTEGAILGIAVTSVSDSNGVWQYTTDGTNWNTIASSSPAAGSALLLAPDDKLRFVPSANYNGSATGGVTFKAWDRTSGAAGDTNANTTTGNAWSTGTATAAINVNPVNDAPAVGTNNSLTLNEGATATITNAQLNENDPDDSGTGLTYTVTAVPTNGTLKLNATALVNNGTFTQDDIDNSRVTYTHDGSETTSDSFTFSLADGGEDGAAAVTGQTFNITVTPQNDAPTIANLDGDTSDSVIAIGNTNLDKNADATVTDPDSADFNTGTLVIVRTAGTANGNFSFDATTVISGGDAVIAAGETVSVGGTDVGTVHATLDGQAGNNLTITFNANATAARITNLIQNILYTAPSATDTRTFTVTLSDGDGGTSALSTVTISVVANNKPTAADKTITMNENSTYTFTIPDFNFSDADAGDSLQKVKITTLPAAGTLALSNVAVTINQEITGADITAGNLKFTPVSNAFASPYATFGFAVNDGKEYSAAAYTMTVNVSEYVAPPPPPSTDPEPQPEVTYNNQVIGSGTVLPNNSDHTGVTVGAGGTVINNATLTDLTNNGTVTGGTVSGDSENQGLLSGVTLSEGTILNNAGGTVSGSVNEGTIFGGTVSGTVTNTGIISGLAPDGTQDPSYSITIGSGSVVTGGEINGSVTNLGTLNNVTLGAGTSLSFTNESGGQTGQLTGTITIASESGTGCVISIPTGVIFPEPGSLPQDGFVLTPEMLIAYANEHGWDVVSRSKAAKASTGLIPEIPGGYILVGGIVLSETGSKSSSDVSVSIPYVESLIPEGYSADDVKAMAYDHSDNTWISVPSTRSGESALKISTKLITAYAAVIKINTNPAQGTISVSQISGDTSEYGTIATFTVVLGAAPSSDVTIGLTSSDLTEGVISTSSLVFTPENWNIPQTVSVIGVDDDIVDGDQSYFIVTGASVSDDPSYNGIDPSDVSVINTDNDTNGTYIPASVSPENGAMDVSMTPVLNVMEPGAISGFATHAKTQWQVSKASDFAPFDLVFSLTGSGSLCSVKVPYLALTPGTTYFWRARFIDNQGNATAWSQTSRFRVVSVNPDDTNNNGVADAYEISAATDLDANGTDDASQTDMLRTQTSTGDVMIGVKTTGSVISIESAIAAPESEPKAEDQLLGMLEVRASVTEPGAEIEITVHSSKALDSTSGWSAFSTDSGWYDYSSNVNFSQDGRCVTVKLKDGGYGDDDGCANGIIVHKAALPKAAASVVDPDTPDSGSGGGGSCFIETATDSPKWLMAGLAAMALLLALRNISKRNR